MLNLRCISFDSYIKPQLTTESIWGTIVVYLLIPTSNHNFGGWYNSENKVVYLLIPTSNHNWRRSIMSATALYIF